MLRSLVEPLECRLLLARALGVDVYSGDGAINWTSVKNSGISFAWAKATEGVNFTDTQFANNMANASAAGVYIGGYDFARWDTHLFTQGAHDEAANFWGVIQPYIQNAASNGHYLMPVLDLERGPGGLEPTTKGYNKTTFSQWANTWCQDIVADAASIGVTITPVIYTGVSFANAYLDSTVSAKWPLWMSNYAIGQPATGDPSGTTPWTQWQAFQYSATGTVPGIGAGAVDLDSLQGDTQVLKDYVIGSPGRFADGTWVRVNTGALNAWNNPTSDSNAGDTATAVQQDTVGKILQGPYYAKSFWRWQVQYNNGVTGWSAEYQDGVDGTDWLVTATPTAPTNLNVTGPVNALPATFTWTAGTNVASYDVYLDTVKQATVTSNSWTHGAIPTGNHTWHVVATNGNLSADSALASFTYDTVPPTASFGAQLPTVGSPTFDFTINYADATTALLASSFDSGDISVTGPGGVSLPVTFVSVNTPGDGSPRTVTYRVSAPGGTWDATDNGNWLISQLANEVRDTAGNFRPASPIAAFNVNLPFAYVSAGTLQIVYAGTNSVTLSNDPSGNVVAQENATSLPFAPGSFSNIFVQGTNNNDAIVITAALTQPITFNGQSGADSITIGAGGSVAFPTDAAAMSADLDVTIQSGGSTTFSANQHLDALDVSGAASLIDGAGRVIVARSLNVAGSLDLNNNNLVIDYPAGGDSALGSWDGSAYTGVSGLVASGAIHTSMGDALHILGVAESSAVLGGDGGMFFGQTVDASAVIVKFTYGGDANLDGKLNIDDYTKIDTGFAAGLTGWINGDFNRDGKINIDDYLIIDSDYTAQGSPI